MKFKYDNRNWVEFRNWLGIAEVDFHYPANESQGTFHDNMQHVEKRTMDALSAAQRDGLRYLLFTHGSSTSGPGRMSARSQVRTVMRSKDATPFIIRSQCIQHSSVFVAAIRPATQPFATMAVDIYDSDSYPGFCLVVLAGAAPVPLVDDLRSCPSATAPLSLRAAGMTLGALVDAKLAEELARTIATQGGVLLPKKTIIESTPDRA